MLTDVVLQLQGSVRCKLISLAASNTYLLILLSDFKCQSQRFRGVKSPGLFAATSIGDSRIAAYILFPALKAVRIAVRNFQRLSKNTGLSTIQPELIPR
jgi:hypothetical protein